MQLKDLVEELRENILRDTSTAVAAKSEGYLLSDRSLVRYINDAQSRFAARTLCLRDESTPEICRVALVEGQDSYPLDKRVIAVYGVTTDRRLSIHRTTYAYMTGGGSADQSLSSAAWLHADAGCPRFFYTDRESGRIGIYPAPNADYAGHTLLLRVARLPKEELVAEKINAEPEIPAEYHLDLLEWAAWRALRNHDQELENLQKASAHKKAFEDTVRELSLKAKRLLLQDVQFATHSNW